MALTDAELQNLGNTLATRLAYMSLHNGAPGSTGANEISGGGYARQAVTFNVDGDGDLSLAATASFTGTASQAVSDIGFFSAATGGTFRGSWTRSGDAAFSTGGQYNVTAGTIIGTSS